MDRLKILITEQETWTLSKGENDGFPFILRFRPNLKEFSITKEYCERIILLWKYNSTDNSLLPTEEEMDLMEEVENSLVEILENDLQAILSFVYSGQNKKEWHWYSRNIDETCKRINDALSGFEILPIELLLEDDPEWSEYNAVIDGAEDSDSEEELAEK